MRVFGESGTYPDRVTNLGPSELEHEDGGGSRGGAAEPPPTELLRDVVGRASPRCRYAEARWVERRAQRLAVINGHPRELAQEDSGGVGIRVLAGSGWGLKRVMRRLYGTTTKK